MGGVNLFGLVLIVVGGGLVYLGVTGKYQFITGAVAGSSNSASSKAAAAKSQAFSQGVTSGLGFPGLPAQDSQAFTQGLGSSFGQFF